MRTSGPAWSPTYSKNWPNPEPETPQAEQELKNLLERLETTQVLLQEAEAKKAAAEEERRRRTSQLEQVKRRRMAHVKDLRRGQVDRKDLLLDEDIADRAATLAEETPAAAWRQVQETTAARLPGDLAEIASDQSFLREFVELIPDEETRSRLLAFVDDGTVGAALSKLAADSDKGGTTSPSSWVTHSSGEGRRPYFPGSSSRMRSGLARR